MGYRRKVVVKSASFCQALLLKLIASYIPLFGGLGVEVLLLLFVLKWPLQKAILQSKSPCYAFWSNFGDGTD